MKNITRYMGAAFIITLLVIMTGCGEAGPQGEQGNPGMPGSTVEIKEGIDQDGYPNMTWWINGEDTNIAVAGKDGDVGTLDSVLTIGTNGNWFIDGHDTLRPARGFAGTQITISHDNTWVVDGVDTHISLTGPKGEDGAAGTLNSVLGISSETGNWVINGNDTGVAASSGGSGGNGGNGGGGEPSTPPCAHATTSWRMELPMPVIASLEEEMYCTICDEGVNRRRTYNSLTTWLKAQSGGTTVNNPINLEIAINLGNVGTDTGGWGDLLTSIQSAGKYVSLDLTDCTITGTNFQIGNAFTTGKTLIVGIVFPRIVVPTGNTSITVPNGLTNLKKVKGYGNVGEYAFNGCTSLIEAIFPYATTIGNEAFRGCTGLTEISFPVATSIGQGAFALCTALTEVSFPNATGIIGIGAFDGCTQLAEVDFPNAITIHNQTFKNCTSLVKVNFPNVTSINNNSFENCTGLSVVSFPNVTTLYLSIFTGCSNLKELYFPELTTVNGNAFNGCIALERLYIPILRNIANGNNFTGCEALTNITIARNATIDATGLSARAAAFRTYYEGTGGREMGTYTWNGTAWTGAF